MFSDHFFLLIESLVLVLRILLFTKEIFFDWEVEVKVWTVLMK
jgi:hypothetical protein